MEAAEYPNENEVLAVPDANELEVDWDNLDWSENHNWFEPNETYEEDLGDVAHWVKTKATAAGETQAAYPPVHRRRLNPIQRRAFNLFTRAVKAGRSLNMMMLGDGGCGKSFTINAIRTYLEAENKKVMVLATTGKAASLIAGSTLQSSSDGLWINPRQ